MDPRLYWNNVAKRIAERKGKNVIAGDDEPYYRYKRKKFLKLFHQIDFSGKRILEVGPGPGGNLLEVLKHKPLELHGLDIAEEMVALARQNLAGLNVSIEALNNQKFQYPHEYFDLSFTSTVLQHVTDEKVLKNLISEICRVTRKDVYIFERIEKRKKGNDLNIGRTITDYTQLFATHSFELKKVQFLDIYVSYLTSGTIRKCFNSSTRKEGEQISVTSRVLQNIILPISKVLDTIIKQPRDLALLHFKRK